jgi:hypothetical protein
MNPANYESKSGYCRGLVALAAFALFISVYAATAGVAPFFFSQPQSLSVLVSSNAAFNPAVGGDPPFTYGWLKNGQPMTGATGLSLAITNAQSSDAGTYALAVTNDFGFALSSNATLTVIDVGAALNASSLIWTSYPTWFPQTNVTHDGMFAASSGPLGVGQASFLRTTVEGPCTMSFWWKSAGTIIPATVTIDHKSPVYTDGTAAWQKTTLYVGSDDHLVEWNPATSAASTMYVDEVAVTPGATPPLFQSNLPSVVALAGTNISFAMQAVGTPPLAYGWSFQGSPVAGGTNTILSLTNIQASQAGTYTLGVTNDYGFTNLSFTLSVTPSAPWFLIQPLSQRTVPGGVALLVGEPRGSEPLSYQWKYEGGDIPGATQRELMLRPVTNTQAGTYQLSASNALGTQLSTGRTLLSWPGASSISWPLREAVLFQGLELIHMAQPLLRPD